MGEPVRRRSTHEDFPQIISLLTSTFPGFSKSNPEIWEWQYRQNPFGDALSWVTELDGKIVMHMAFLPLPIRVDRKELVAGLGVDVATAEEHRGQGLLGGQGRLMNVAMALWDWIGPDIHERDISVVYFFPRASSKVPKRYRGGVFGTQVELELHVLPLMGSWVARQLRIPRFLASALMPLLFRKPKNEQARQMGRNIEDIQDLWERVEGKFPFGVSRNARWWNWRYVSRPRIQYRFFELRRSGRLAGAAVTLMQKSGNERIVLIMDLLAEDEDAGRQIVGSIARSDPDAVAITMLTAPNSYSSRLAKAAGFRRVPKSLDPDSLRMVIIDVQGDVLGKIPVLPDNAANLPWNISWGDLDHH